MSFDILEQSHPESSLFGFKIEKDELYGFYLSMWRYMFS